MRIAIDVMGGDNAPGAILEGSLAVVDELGADDRLVLVGDREVIARAVAEKSLEDNPKIEIEATTQVIAMDESPVTALRGKPDSSIARIANLGSKRRGGDKYCDIIISAGNTGACVASAQMAMRRLPGVHRPGIAVTMPTFTGPIVLCDAGANPEPKASHLHQYAQMASIYSKRVMGIENPRVALLSIGGEEGKGNSLVKEASKLIREDASVNFVGNIEGRELFAGSTEVVVTEGFTGNVVIKLAEGLAAGLFKTIGREIMKKDPGLAKSFQGVVQDIYKKHDYHEYGGAPLLGANGICIICHGSSEARTIGAAIRTAMAYSRYGVNEGIVEALKDMSPVAEGAA